MPDLAELLRAAVAGERLALARLLTAIESDAPGVAALLPSVYQAGHGAHLIGVTGPPGSGKSTLVNALVGEWRRRGRRVGVLAVDPSSPYTGGAIMGDRIRMMEHTADRDVFVRSMASRGELGGLAATTWIGAAALDAAGYDPVLVETVGAGQSEVEIASLAETTIVVEVPEMGDEVQAIKAGLLEIADVIVVNKSDLPGAERAARRLRAMLSTAGGRIVRQPPKVLLTNAITAEGVPELVEMVDALRSAAREPGRERRRAERQVRNSLGHVALRKAKDAETWELRLDAVAARDTDPMTAAESLLDDAFAITFMSKKANYAERLEQAIHGGLTAEMFPAIAAYIEEAVERGEWYEPAQLMEDMLFSGELDAVTPHIEERARQSERFRRQLVFTMHGFGGRGGEAIDRLSKLADEYRAQYVDELGAEKPPSTESSE